MKEIDTLVYWTSPKGKTFALKATETGYKQKHIGEVKENPKSKKSNRKKIQDVSDTFKDFGIGGRDLNLKFYFFGENHATESEAFENALCETGKSKLQIPYRAPFTVNVLDFEVANDLKIVNQTVVSVQFHQTSHTKFPTAVKSQKKAIKNMATLQSAKIAETLETTVSDIQGEVRQNSFVSSFSAALNKVNGILAEVNNVSVNSIMADIMGQDVLSNVGTIAAQLQTSFREVGRLKTTVSDFTDFNFGNLVNLSALSALTSIINAFKIRGYYKTKSDIDKLVINKSVGGMALLAEAETAADKAFTTRKEAVEAASNLKENFENWNDFVENELENITDLADAPIDDGGMRDVINKTANAIIEESFDLKIEKRIILTESTTPFELAYKYYAEDFATDPDGTVDYLIKTNDLADDEFFMLEVGRAVKIYV